MKKKSNLAYYVLVFVKSVFVRKFLDISVVFVIIVKIVQSIVKDFAVSHVDELLVDLFFVDPVYFAMLDDGIYIFVHYATQFECKSKVL